LFFKCLFCEIEFFVKMMFSFFSSGRKGRLKKLPQATKFPLRVFHSKKKFNKFLGEKKANNTPISFMTH
jgi:hypothetical protein